MTRKECFNLSSKLYALTDVYVKSTKDYKLRGERKLRAIALNSAIETCEGLKGVVFPENLTDSVIKQCEIDSTNAFNQ